MNAHRAALSEHWPQCPECLGEHGTHHGRCKAAAHAMAVLLYATRVLEPRVATVTGRSVTRSQLALMVLDHAAAQRRNAEGWACPYEPDDRPYGLTALGFLVTEERGVDHDG